MATTVLDPVLFRDAFGTPAMRAIFEDRVLVGEFGGAAGTLASLGDRGLEVQKLLMEELQLGAPVATWHVAR